jgi:copper resistance protein B
MRRAAVLAFGWGLFLSAPAWGESMGDHAAHETPQTPTAPAASAPPADHAADRFYAPGAMAHARAMLAEDHGGMPASKVTLNIAEYLAGAGGGYRWNAEAWYGGDLNRIVVKSEGDGGARDGLEQGEVQALYARPLGPYADLQVGLRQDFAPHARTYATAGVEALLPYRIEAAGALFVSPHGDLLARAEGSYDLRLAQRWVLQPRAELNFAVRDTPETRTGAGLARSELGLRLRYEIGLTFAPYVGVTYDRSFGRTADYARAADEPVEHTSFVAGLRAFF